MLANCPKRCLVSGYYFISDIVIYLIYIDLMRKRCQLINVDVDVDVDCNMKTELPFLSGSNKATFGFGHRKFSGIEFFFLLRPPRKALAN